MIGRAALILVLLLAWPSLVGAQERAADIVLKGRLTGADHQTYRELPFRTPSGVTRITVHFAYGGRAERTVVDIGLRDPERFRGWSGGNKSRFTLAETDATPSYLAGPIKPGTWRLVLGVPNLRKGASAEYEASIWFERKGGAGRLAEPPLAVEARWWRGDLHLHTGHSDGYCAATSGEKRPCPLARTVEAAARRGLDFIAITDHNTTSHLAAMRELEAHYDRLLLIPGREITTFQGHANVFGATGPIDFTRGLGRILGQSQAQGGLFSINHPSLPSGEACMGCGWTFKDTDFSRVAAIEVVNGAALAQTGLADGPLSGIAFWEAQLDAGRRITAIGGSDNHDALADPAKPGAVGIPATVVRAASLSTGDILDGIRRGHVFIDVEGAPDRLLEVQAQAGGGSAEMGDLLPVAAGASVRIEAHVKGAAGGVIRLAGPAAKLVSAPNLSPLTADDRRSFELTAPAARSWLRLEVRSPQGRLLLLGNPIHFTPPAP